MATKDTGMQRILLLLSYCITQSLLQLTIMRERIIIGVINIIIMTMMMIITNDT